MRYALPLLLLLLTLPAQAQERTFVHQFDDRTVYIEVAEHWLEVWSRSDGQCVMYPSAPEVSKGKITFPAGTTWEISAVEGGLEITFPKGRTVTYTATRKDPQALCLGSHGV